MRIALWIWLLILPTVAFADCYGGASAKNAVGEKIYITSGVMRDYPAPCDLNEIEVYPRLHPKLAEPSRFEFRVECKYVTDKEPYYFRCRSDGRSPLAGATYKITKSKKRNGCGEPWTIYRCVSGCNGKRVPKTFYEKPWEC